MAAQRTYLAIDLKSFYASVECVDRHLDPLTTKDYDKPEHFVQITLDADGNAKSDRATVKVEG